MTRLQAVIGANVLLGILAFFLITTGWREGEVSTRFEELKIAESARLHTVIPARVETLSQADLERLRAVSTLQSYPLQRAQISPAVTVVIPPDVEVTLDPSGRPYDVPLTKGATVERRRLAVLHAPSRHIAFMGGEEVPYPYVSDHTTVVLAERPGRLYPVDAIWVHEQHGFGSIVGVVMVERDAPVTRWTTLQETAYGTDSGLGAITTREWLRTPEGPGGNVLARQLDEWPNGSQFFVEDVDGQPGPDTLVFQNGFGDGGFPAVAGYDASGARTAIVLWTKVAPWRLAFPQGTPPQRVTQRENTLAACLAGRRSIDGAGCRPQG